MKDPKRIIIEEKTRAEQEEIRKSWETFKKIINKDRKPLTGEDENND